MFEQPKFRKVRRSAKKSGYYSLKHSFSPQKMQSIKLSPKAAKAIAMALRAMLNS